MNGITEFKLSQSKELEINSLMTVGLHEKNMHYRPFKYKLERN